MRAVSEFVLIFYRLFHRFLLSTAALFFPPRPWCDRCRHRPQAGARNAGVFFSLCKSFVRRVGCVVPRHATLHKLMIHPHSTCGINFTNYAPVAIGVNGYNTELLVLHQFSQHFLRCFSIVLTALRAIDTMEADTYS